MKLLTLLVDNRVNHVIDFERVVENEAPLETYVINKNLNTELFSFYNSLASEYDQDEENGEFDAEYDDKKHKEPTAKPRGIILQDEKGQQTIFLESVNYKDNVIEIVLSTQHPTISPSIPNELELTLDSLEAPLWPMSLRSSNNDTLLLIISFTLKYGSITYPKRSIQLCLASPDDIRDVVLDFGSEASQMAIFDQKSMSINDIRHLFEDMEDLLERPSFTNNENDTTSEEKSEKAESNETESEKSTSEKEDSDLSEKKDSNDYVQEENDDKRLYKSIFYAEANPTNKDSSIPKLNGNNIQRLRTLSLLTTEDDAQKLLKNGYIQIPNIKISGFGGIEEPKIDGCPLSEYNESFFYRAPINHFVLNGLLKADAPCIRLYVLMPNVYSHFDVCTHLEWLRKDISEIINQNKGNNEKSLELKTQAVEISAISESDASLMGALDLLTNFDNETPFEDGCYLIIDAGKGTTDFSIVKYENAKVISMFRSGIIGAGNAVSYAHLFGLLYDYFNDCYDKKYNESDLSTFVYKQILKVNDLSKLRDLMQNIDRYKIVAGSGIYKEDPNITYSKLASLKKDTIASSTIDTVTINDFTDFVEDMVKDDKRTFKPLSEEAQLYVNGMFNKITDSVCKKLKITSSEEFNNIKGAIFTGRAFLDLRLQDAISDALKKKGINNIIHYLREDLSYTHKNICLFICEHILNGTISNRMLCHPYARIRRKKQGDKLPMKGHESFASKWGRWLRSLFPKRIFWI